MSHDTTSQPTLLLPDSVATKRNLVSLVHEVECIDETMIAAEVKAKVGVEASHSPELSDHLASFLTLNHLSLDGSRTRSQLVAYLRRLKDQAPVVHMTFATEADDDSLRQLAAWVRQSVHPQAVMTVGLQPDLIGGVHVRTANHVQDLSIRARLKDARHSIVEELEAIHAGR